MVEEFAARRPGPVLHEPLAISITFSCALDSVAASLSSAYQSSRSKCT
jgi:hypothetical protein